MRFKEFLIEASEFKKLQNNKQPLSGKEHAEVMNKKAVWHHGPKGEETSAVWKSVDKKGNVTYVTNTHRAMATNSSLKGAISDYHAKIKNTA